ncbi:MAG TPA: hypothetical protein H9815_08440 [Candidatus Ruania gallistercoris]|uniref:Aerotolerance regulator N-terminal domain-containing protein n=1 Tax=Candidatus Ruania gallistercoris TaxID=2838746 RepID=A0A9D2EE54_9MICO|nr:hypothetical protein [Candidatus Ruania gallistercoris]
MWTNVELAPWMLIPPAIVILLAVWGLVSPQSQWRTLWRWQGRYRLITDRAAQDNLVRRSSIAPLLVCIALMVILVIAL